MGKFGGKENSPATVYPVQIDDDKKVYVLLEGNAGDFDQQRASSPTARGTRTNAKAPKTPRLSMGERPRPMDTNICLSLLDGVLSPCTTSKTTELNVVANCVSRAMLYGTKRDKDDIATRLDEMAETFPIRWSLSSSTSTPGSAASGQGLAGGRGGSQEATFIRALALLLRRYHPLTHLPISLCTFDIITSTYIYVFSYSVHKSQSYLAHVLLSCCFAFSPLTVD